MACPGECIAGGGQPYHHGKLDILEKRADALYSEDEKKVIRQSHKNLSVQKIYEEFLGDIYGESAHFYLHIILSKSVKPEGTSTGLAPSVMHLLMFSKVLMITPEIGLKLDSIHNSNTLEGATIVKLTRTLAIIPITLGLSFYQIYKQKQTLYFL